MSSYQWRILTGHRLGPIHLPTHATNDQLHRRQDHSCMRSLEACSLGHFDFLDFHSCHVISSLYVSRLFSVIATTPVCKVIWTCSEFIARTVVKLTVSCYYANMFSWDPFYCVYANKMQEKCILGLFIMYKI